MDPNAALLNSQHPSGLAEIAKIKNLPYREGIGSLTHASKPDIVSAIAITAQFLEELPQISSDKPRGGEELPGSIQGGIQVAQRILVPAVVKFNDDKQKMP